MDRETGRVTDPGRDGDAATPSPSVFIGRQSDDTHLLAGPHPRGPSRDPTGKDDGGAEPGAHGKCKSRDKSERAETTPVCGNPLSRPSNSGGSTDLGVPCDERAVGSI